MPNAAQELEAGNEGLEAVGEDLHGMFDHLDHSKVERNDTQQP